MNNRLNSNKKANNSRLFLIIAALIIVSGVVIIFLLSNGGPPPEPESKIVRKSIRVTDPTKPPIVTTTKVTTAPVKTAEKTATKAVTPVKTAKAPKPKASTAKAKTVKTKKAVSSVKTTAKASGRTMYAIHVASFNGEKYAIRLEKAIDRAGYNAYVTKFVKDNVNWYRVRVGFFKAKDDAKKTSAIISKRFKQPGAWLVRPPKDEVEKNKI